MTVCVKKVLPVFNRCVIFSTTDTSYHGHPDPLMCPEDITRKSIALYYYSNGRPAGEVTGHHSTTFQTRPGEKNVFVPRAVVKKLVPPLLLDVARFVRAKFSPAKNNEY